MNFRPSDVREGISAAQPNWLDLKEDVLLSGCHFEAFRGPGPGGQKRNKTSSTIRLTHPPTGIHVIAGESRSQAENKARAVRRLKLKLATDIRHPINTGAFELPAWFTQVVQLGRLSVSRRNAHYARTAALILDLLGARGGRLVDVARLLGVSTRSVAKFLFDESQLWTAANLICKAAGHPPLEKR